MKKILLFTLVLQLTFIFGVNGARIISNGTGGGNWKTGSTWQGGAIPINGDIVEILAGDLINVENSNVNFNGSIEVYGTLTISGKLIMNATSTIKVAVGGNIDAIANGNNDRLTIGGQTILDNDINTLASPNQITEETLGDGNGGCAETGNCNPDPLPIELLYLKSNIISEGVALTWATAKEDNFDYFSVERSKNGSDYEEIAQINGAGYSRSILNYGFTDASPLNGKAYYRLKSIDLDLSYEYSQPIAVNAKGSVANTISVSPNPLEGTQFNVLAENIEDDTQVLVYDMAGILVRELKYISGVSLDFETPLKSGIYMVVLSSAQSQGKTKLVVR